MAGMKEIADNWRELLKQLPGVMDAELCFTGEELSEIHILSDTERMPKQIVRDVQSAMMAKYKVDIDHKIISVARIPNAKRRPEPERRIVFSGLDLSLDNEGCSVTVRLLCDGKICSATQKSDNAKGNRYRAIAVATAQAVGFCLKNSASITVNEIRTAGLGDANVVIVSVYMKSGTAPPELLIGASVEDENEAVCAVRATLDAVNRKVAIVRA